MCSFLHLRRKDGKHFLSAVVSRLGPMLLYYAPHCLGVVYHGAGTQGVIAFYAKNSFSWSILRPEMLKCSTFLPSAK